MKVQRLLLATLVAGLLAGQAAAQERVAPPQVANHGEPQIQLSTDRVQTTPEMWFYQQEQARYENPKDAVRRKAAYAATQRQWRIAMMKAQGLSKLRPTTTHTPFFNTYLPTQDPYRWGFGRGVMEVQAPVTTYQR